MERLFSIPQFGNLGILPKAPALKGSFGIRERLRMLGRK
jgi:hypothetical protein